SVERLLGELRASSAPSEEEVRAEYRLRPDRYREPEAAFFRQVVAVDRPSAEEAAKRIRAGESIEKVGEELGAGRTGFEKGAAELRMFRGNPDPREPVLFRLKPGEVSDPVEVPGGFAVVRLERRTPARQVPFEEVRDRIAEALHARKAQTAIRELVKGLRSRAKIERLPLPEEASTPPGSPVPSPRP
ncbi:MAG: peptidylprolyl isomerase, partial [Armatimonadetes bacterium]|nr:peptidylprolyl isomerase [Armatimonadota bacterium]MDW8154708.1 peptidylprolyl isomerase [Armatimonadota bacterium]